MSSAAVGDICVVFLALRELMKHFLMIIFQTKFNIAGNQPLQVLGNLRRSAQGNPEDVGQVRAPPGVDAGGAKGVRRKRVRGKPK